jgi:ketosteroid isomerase-like protein
MKRIIASIIVSGIATAAFAQKPIEGLVQAEKNFAAYSVKHGTKEAFIAHADSTGIVFDNGKPVNAIELWTKRESRPGTLNWSPEYAEIAASGDFGYTTGPWNFSLYDTIRAWGYFNSVWHINKKGEWKFLVDLGVSNIHCDFASLEKAAGKNDSRDKGTEASLKEAEEKLIAAYGKQGKTAYKDFLSTHSRLYRHQSCAALTKEQQQASIDALPSAIQYTINGTGIASSGEIGYVYGTTVINGKADNYLRIWRKEKDGWKITLEVLRF